MRTATAKPTAATTPVLRAASVTFASGSTRVFAAAPTVSIWRRPVTLFTVAAAAAVVVILGGAGLVASTRPVTLSAAPSAEPIEGSTGVIEDAGPDRASDLPTLAQPELPLVAPVDPGLPPVAITNPNVGRGPLRPGAPTPRPSPFYAPMSFASSDAPTEVYHALAVEESPVQPVFVASGVSVAC